MVTTKYFSLYYFTKLIKCTDVSVYACVVKYLCTPSLGAT